jgi:hypothetical protein
MSLTAEVIPFPVIPIMRRDVPDTHLVPGDRVRQIHRLRDPESFSTLDKKLASSETMLFVELGLVIEELIRIAGQDFTLEAIIMQAKLRGGLDLIGMKEKGNE